MLDESQIQQETMRVIQGADAAARVRAAPALGRAAHESRKVPRVRNAVSVVKAVVDATTAAEDTSEESTAAATAHRRAEAAAPESPKRWDWKQWQQQEQKALSLSSSLPTSAAAAEKIAEKSASLRIAAAKAAAAKIADQAASTRQQQEKLSEAHPASAPAAHAKSAAREASTGTGVEAAATAASTAEPSAGLAHKKALVHAQARARQVLSKGGATRASKGKTAPELAQYQSKWNWAQWQEMAKKLLLHSGSAAHSLAPSAPAPAAVSPPAVQAEDKAKEKEKAALQMQIIKLQQMQHNAEALKKVETQDASIKAKISSVMHHVEQVDKEKQALALGDSRSEHGSKNDKDNFTIRRGKLVATSLSKSTLKAMKEAQLAGLEADNAAKARAAAAARKNYAKMRDEMFRKDAMKQVRDEQQLRAEKEAARAGSARGKQIITHANEKLVKSLDQQTRREDPIHPHLHLHVAVPHAKAVETRTNPKKKAVAPPAAHPRTAMGFLAHLFG